MRTPRALPFAVALAIALLVPAAPGNATPDAAGAGTSAPADARASEPDNWDDVTTGSTAMTPEDRRKKRFEDCMAIWEPATHMTKRQWRRTCNSQLDEANP